ncbi:hypothetical protein NDN08_001900 [Rhodosorus marinus]|uniref:Uncharacterized protein n=1 Tax=Rhodosorus marinus TaxID=101924 RepID=A0AAV8UWB4_9RHOD|nr:hypothetical protein NDN08_001900 [Rhodosorus marinus]
MAKGGSRKVKSVLIKLLSEAGTGYFYMRRKNPKNLPHKLQLMKLDPIVALAAGDSQIRIDTTARYLFVMKCMKLKFGKPLQNCRMLVPLAGFASCLQEHGGGRGGGASSHSSHELKVMLKMDISHKARALLLLGPGNFQ